MLYSFDSVLIFLILLKFLISRVRKNNYLHGRKHISHSPLHQKVVFGGIGGANHRQVERHNGVGEGSSAHVRLKPPELAAFVGHSVVRVPNKVNFFLLLSKS